MFRRLLLLVLVMLLAGLVASFLGSQGGFTTIEWLGWRVEARTSLLVALFLFLLVLVVIFDRLLGFLLGLPSRLSGRLQRHRSERGYSALALGLVAVSSGDEREALRQSRRARRLLGDGLLTDLLSAQASSLSGDEKAAARFFERLSLSKETSFFGQAGLMSLHVEGGRDDEALLAGREAFRLRRNVSSFSRALFALEARQGNWDEALDALSSVRRDSSFAEGEADHLLSVLSFKKAESEAASGASGEAVLRTLERSLRYDGGFVPAILRAREILLDMGKERRVRRLLDRGLKVRCHPALVEAYYDDLVSSGKSEADSLLRVVRLVDRLGNDWSCLLLLSRLAFRLELWGESLRLVRLIPEDELPVGGWQLLTELSEVEPEGGIEGWPDRVESLRGAVGASEGYGWYCGGCGLRHDGWDASCSGCDSFGSLSWLARRKSH